MKATVSEKGQITIPKRLRERLGIRPGQVLDVREEPGRIVLSKSEGGDVFERATGVLKPDLSTDELIRELRGEADAI